MRKGFGNRPTLEETHEDGENFRKNFVKQEAAKPKLHPPNESHVPVFRLLTTAVGLYTHKPRDSHPAKKKRSYEIRVMKSSNHKYLANVSFTKNSSRVVFVNFRGKFGEIT